MKMILNNVKNRLLEAAVTEQNTLVKTYSAGSYTEEKVAEMREAFGENKLSRHQNDSVLKRIFEAFVNPFTVILIVLALVSFITDVVMAAPGEKDRSPGGFPDCPAPLPLAHAVSGYGPYAPGLSLGGGQARAAASRLGDAGRARHAQKAKAHPAPCAGRAQHHRR